MDTHPIIVYLKLTISAGIFSSIEYIIVFLLIVFIVIDPLCHS